MKILLVNDLVQYGGTEVQHWQEFDLLSSRGHDVYSLTMDSKHPASLEGTRRNIPIEDKVVGKTISRFVPGLYLRQLRSQINEIAPDIIHFNNVRKASQDLYCIARCYPCVQTVRDYGAVCPKGTCIHVDGAQCLGFAKETCGSCKLGLKDQVKAMQMDGLTRANLAACELRVAPSVALANCCTENGLPTRCLNDPFDFSVCGFSEETTERDFASRDFLYFGTIDWIKGIDQLLEAFDGLVALHPDSKLQLVGSIAPAYKKTFEDAIARRSYVSYLGRLPHDEMLHLVKKSYCVVVPSLWLENYPNTVLEALANKTLVIGTNRGGIPEMIGHDELLFDVLNVNSITETLDFAYTLSPSEYEEIVSSGYAFVLENNTLDRYGERLERIFEEAIDIYACKEF